MPYVENCTRCKGKGYLECLVSQHDDVKEIAPCIRCNGTGSYYVMTQEEENDYRESNGGW